MAALKHGASVVELEEAVIKREGNFLEPEPTLRGVDHPRLRSSCLCHPAGRKQPRLAASPTHCERQELARVSLQIAKRKRQPGAPGIPTILLFIAT